jgi:hypothetical protein
MYIHFITRGRLGNAIFRYLACVLMCINLNGTYLIEKDNNNSIHVNDESFIKIMENILNNTPIEYTSGSITMMGFFQHDIIFLKYKTQIINFITSHKDHYILTDGILAGDNQCEKFYMYDIIKTPTNFKKKYDVVLHLRLEDFVIHNLSLSTDRIILLIDKLIANSEIKNTICIVCNKLKTEIENDYYNKLKKNFEEQNIHVILENNDVLTDYYIMRECNTLICSNSTLSWAAALLSDKISKCYFPDYKKSPNQTCKYPIENTTLY